MGDIYDAFNNTSAVSQISRSDNGRLEMISFESKSETVDFEGDTYEASEVINQLRNGSQFEEVEFQNFVRKSNLDTSSEGPSTGLIIISYMMATLFPIVGIILGIVTWVKGSTSHGVGAIGLSIGSWIFWAALML